MPQEEAPDYDKDHYWSGQRPILRRKEPAERKHKEVVRRKRQQPSADEAGGGSNHSHPRGGQA